MIWTYPAKIRTCTSEVDLILISIIAMVFRPSMTAYIKP